MQSLSTARSTLGSCVSVGRAIVHSCPTTISHGAQEGKANGQWVLDYYVCKISNVMSVSQQERYTLKKLCELSWWLTLCLRLCLFSVHTHFDILIFFLHQFIIKVSPVVSSPSIPPPLFADFLSAVPLLLLCSVSWRGAVAEERIRGGLTVWAELSGHLLLLSCQLQPLRRGLRVSGGALPEHRGRVCHPRPLPLPWPGRPAGGTHTHRHARRLKPN